MSLHLPASDHGFMDPAPVLYTIRIHGHLGPAVLLAFPALVPQHHGADTVLTGLLDRSALYGVLAEVEALGLDLLEVRQVPPYRESPGSGITPLDGCFGTGRRTAEKGVVDSMPDATSTGGARDQRWVVLGVIGLAQLMVILDLTVMNIALPSAQRALDFTTVDRQWVVTAYTLAFGSLLLLGGRLADLLGRKVTFLAGLVGFAGVSAIGGASVNFAMLITARACQGAFAALLVPSALSLLTTTFTEPKDRAKAFGIYGAIAGAGGALGLLLGGALTQYLSWRWTLYVNLIFAAVAFAGGALLLRRQPSPVKPRLDVPGVLLVSGGVFCLVYGFSNAAAHTWHTPSTYGFLAAGVVLLTVFAAWQGRSANPLLPPRVVLDRNRGGAYLSFFIGAAGMFGVFLFLTYYLQQTLGYSPLVTGVAFLPLSGCLIVMANLSTIVLMPRVGPKPLIAAGMLTAAAGAAWLTQLGQHTGYPAGVLGPLMLAGVGLGMVIAPVINTGTFGVARQDAGVASATVTVGQMLGGSVGTSLLNTIFTAAVTSYISAHLATARLTGRQALTGLALAHGYDTAFWWITGIFAVGAVVGSTLLRPGPLGHNGVALQAGERQTTDQAEASRERAQ
jgi:EmrB/QacA subfamily drug resistance transporter